MTKTIPACTFAAALALGLASTVAVAGDMKTHAGTSESVAQSMMKDKMDKKGDTMMKDGMKKDGMKHDAMKKGGDMKKDGMKHDGMKKGGMMKDGMKKKGM